jgi:putative endonuclease
MARRNGLPPPNPKPLPSPQRQKRRIAAAADVWLADNPLPEIRDIRFDAILVAPGKLPRHIPAAFETN